MPLSPYPVCLCVILQAYSCIEELRTNAPKVNIASYLDQRVLEAIHRALNIPLKDAPVVATSNGYRGYSVNGDDDDDGEIVDEDVAAAD